MEYVNSLSDSILPTAFWSSMNNKHVQRQVFLRACLFTDARACYKGDVKRMFCTVSLVTLPQWPTGSYIPTLFIRNMVQETTGFRTSTIVCRRVGNTVYSVWRQAYQSMRHWFTCVLVFFEDPCSFFDSSASQVPHSATWFWNSGSSLAYCSYSKLLQISRLVLTAHPVKLPCCKLENWILLNVFFETVAFVFLLSGCLPERWAVVLILLYNM